MTVLVIAEHDNQTLNPSTLSTITAALFCSDEIELLVAGSDCQAVVEKSIKINGLKSVLHVDDSAYQHFLAENMAALIKELAPQYTHVLAPASTFGKNIMPRAAALCDVGQVSDITQVLAPNRFVRPIYAGNAMATVSNEYEIQFITVRATAFAKADYGDNSAAIEKKDLTIDLATSNYVKQELSDSSRPELTQARVVVSGGRALQSSENFQILEQLADRLGAAIGASRAAVDAGFVPNDLQVGQTGKVVAPELYIAVGISGAIQHIAGMKDSKVIVAINKDQDAPIFKVADYGLVGDLFKIVPELNNALDQLTQE